MIYIWSHHWIVKPPCFPSYSEWSPKSNKLAFHWHILLSYGLFEGRATTYSYLWMLALSQCLSLNRSSWMSSEWKLGCCWVTHWVIMLSCALKCLLARAVLPCTEHTQWASNILHCALSTHQRESWCWSTTHDSVQSILCPLTIIDERNLETWF